MGQSVRAFALQAEGRLFESRQRQTQVVKTGSNRTTAKCLAIGVSVTVFGDDHYKQMSRVTVEGKKILTAL